MDLLLFPALVSHVELFWTDPAIAKLLRRLASFSRLILFDKLGTGLSDPVVHVPTPEDRVREAVAVLDAAGSQRAAVFALFDGAASACLFAATRKERATSLVLYGAHPVGAHVPDAPSWEEGSWVERFDTVQRLAEDWGEGSTLGYFGGHEVGAAERMFLASMERSSASPGMARAMLRELAEFDLRGVLPTVKVPTLVLHRRSDSIHPMEQARFIAEQIPDARLVALEGRSRWPWLGDMDAFVGEIEEFVTGSRHAPSPDEVLTTVLFTDIVDSTRQAAELGDHRWTALLEEHNRLVREHLVRFDGQEVKNTGDGFLASFDGPVRALRCADAIRGEVRALGIAVRAGVHTGECAVIGDDLGGINVHIGARVGALAGPDEVLVSSTVKDLVIGSGIDFSDRGSHRLKGVPGEWRIFSLADGRSRHTPGRSHADLLGAPGSSMRLDDRVTSRLARHAPRATRLASRLLLMGRGRRV